MIQLSFYFMERPPSEYGIVSIFGTCLFGQRKTSSVWPEKGVELILFFLNNMFICRIHESIVRYGRCLQKAIAVIELEEECAE